MPRTTRERKKIGREKPLLIHWPDSGKREDGGWELRKKGGKDASGAFSTGMGDHGIKREEGGCSDELLSYGMTFFWIGDISLVLLRGEYADGRSGL